MIKQIVELEYFYAIEHRQTYFHDQHGTSVA